MQDLFVEDCTNPEVHINGLSEILRDVALIEILCVILHAESPAGVQDGYAAPCSSGLQMHVLRGGSVKLKPHAKNKNSKTNLKNRN